MIRFKLLKIIIVGLCIALLLPGTALAATEVEIQIEEDKGELINEQPENLERLKAPDTPVSDREIDEEILQKHKEIDKYIFEDHAQELSEKDFIVTRTGPLEDYVEIGISPYSEESANYLYEIFGKDLVKVVEAEQAELLNTATDSLAAEAVSVEATDTNNSFNKQVLYLIGVFILLIIAIITIFRLKQSR